MTKLPRDLSFEDASSSLRAALEGPVRLQIVDEMCKARTFDRSARHLRDGMRAHRFESGGQALFSGHWVKHFDHVTRAEGFHILNDWDGRADRFCLDTIPVEVASFAERVADPADHQARSTGLFILLDYYFLHLIGLLALRAWDHGDPNKNLDVIDRMLALLQGADGSGQDFARDAETLILIATSHFEPDVTAYERLLAKVRRLDRKHRLRLAVTHGAILGCHLRFGLEVTCAGSVPALRDDNVPDYPWLCDALATLLEGYADTEPGADEARARIAEALLLALGPDPEAFLGPHTPDSLSACADIRRLVRERFPVLGSDLLRDFESLRPTGRSYSPLSFTFNFPHNLVKGIVIDAVLRGAPWSLRFDDLLTAFPQTPDLDASRRELAVRLMRYAVANPDTIRDKPHPAIVYDPEGASRVFERTLERLTPSVPASP